MDAKKYDKAYDRGMDKGLAEGHYQADSMQKKINEAMHKSDSCKSTGGAGKAYGGKAGLKK